MIKTLLRTIVLASCIFTSGASFAQGERSTVIGGEAVAAGEDASASFDTSYAASDSVAYTVRRRFLENIRWSAGNAVRDGLTRLFSEERPADIWARLVASDGLDRDNVADALTAYWVLNWVTANAAYGRDIDNRPIQAQVRAAFANDPGFHALTNRQRQEMAETYYLNFLVEHALLNDAVARRDLDTLRGLAEASVVRFRQQMGVNLLALVPGPAGFSPRPAPSQPD